MLLIIKRGRLDLESEFQGSLQPFPAPFLEQIVDLVGLGFMVTFLLTFPDLLATALPLNPQSVLSSG